MSSAKTLGWCQTDFATHDIPTVKGYETGRDIDWWHKPVWINQETAADMHRQRSSEVKGLPEDTTVQSGVLALLAQANAGLVAVQLDDV